MKITDIAMATEGYIKTTTVQQQRRPIELESRLKYDSAGGIAAYALPRRRTLDQSFL